mmetsp:Transcript_1038/g.2999  ORF Transcript_1038/g.2999 Transcript_1038/m.2999 type:complete len:208 (+) Transcript_1038:28-651(+)
MCSRCVQVEWKWRPAIVPRSADLGRRERLGLVRFPAHSEQRNKREAKALSGMMASRLPPRPRCAGCSRSGIGIPVLHVYEADDAEGKPVARLEHREPSGNYEHDKRDSLRADARERRGVDGTALHAKRAADRCEDTVRPVRAGPCGSARAAAAAQEARILGLTPLAGQASHITGAAEAPCAGGALRLLRRGRWAWRPCAPHGLGPWV